MSFEYTQSTHEITENGIEGLEPYNDTHWEACGILPTLRVKPQDNRECIILWKRQSLL